MDSEFAEDSLEFRRLVLRCVIVLTAIACLRLAAQQAKPQGSDRAAQVIPATARVWRSTTTGREYRVWVENERLHAEWVNIPAALVQGGAYIRSECRRVGTKWIGTSRSYLPCEVTELNKRVSNWCHLLTRMEIDAVTAERIAGRGEGLRRFDCKTCKVDETYWADFLWVPKGQTIPRSKR